MRHRRGCPRDTEQRSNASRARKRRDGAREKRDPGAPRSVRARATLAPREPQSRLTRSARARAAIVARKLRLWRAERVARAIAHSYGHELHDLFASGRTHPTVSAARHHLWAVLRATLDLSFPELGRVFGTDHSTIMYGVRKFERTLAAAYAPPPRLDGTEQPRREGL